MDLRYHVISSDRREREILSASGLEMTYELHNSCYKQKAGMSVPG